MTDRRDFMSYLGAGAVGGMVGFYAGAQKLLGIQSSPEQPVGDLDSQTRSPTRSPTEEPTPTEEPVESPIETSSADVLFRDDFDDGGFGSRWSYIEGKRDSDSEVVETDDILRHTTPFSYGSNSPIQSKLTF